MNFTFGIITDGSQDDRLVEIGYSIISLNIPKFEIIAVGPFEEYSEGELGGMTIKKIPFDESAKKSWITRKKNIITEQAKYENIVYLHDYIKFEPDWYEGWLKFGDDWDMAMNKIVGQNGERFRDWCYWDNPKYGSARHIQEKWTNGPMLCQGEARLANYNSTETNYMYVSGSYFVAKKQFMLDNSLDESLGWGEGEDVEHSLRVRPFWNYKMNQNSTVSLMKEKHVGMLNAD